MAVLLLALLPLLFHAPLPAALHALSPLAPEPNTPPSCRAEEVRTPEGEAPTIGPSPVVPGLPLRPEPQRVCGAGEPAVLGAPAAPDWGCCGGSRGLIRRAVEDREGTGAVAGGDAA
eukprot:CAMPEP_0202345042 /NCGR_PEP_ID=MMETSP1126-20121109/4451_1 /ASSEMBLY_ACC=CAM_ASM_000457 /TAXON_ID=3047 /ORGANISM="Dunaliella tertiolecta, Strain CCMP1320" /LENGTH=116 /DNA_ID=CAMNT_0048936291 /DNA_START=604 /DNA_END=954 /DNA_ORIENTATION=-